MNDKSHEPIVFLAVVCGLWGLADWHMHGVPLLVAALFGLWAWAIKATASTELDGCSDHDVI